MATVPKLREETQALLKKAAKATANAEDILKWLNECRRRLQRKAKIRRVWTAPLTGAASYPLAVAGYPILSLTGAKYIPTSAGEGYAIDILPLQGRWREGVRFQKALPNETNHTLWVYPASWVGTLELYGYLQMSVLVDQDSCTPDIEEDFHDLFPLFAASRFGGQDEDFAGNGRFANYERQYLMREQEFIAAMSQGVRTGGRFIRRNEE